MNNRLSELRLAAPTQDDGCPSDLALDLLLAADLDEVRALVLHEHFAACVTCSARFASISAFRDEVANTLPRLAEFDATRPRPLNRARSSGGWWGGALAVAAAVALWVGHGPTAHSPLDGTRAKGSVRLGFYVKRGEQVFRGGPGELLRPGDAIEFSYEAPSDGYLAVLSVDGAGQASVYYPVGSRARALTAGSHLLEQSTTLDAVLGRETLYALWCDGPAELEPLRRALESSAALPVSPGCRIESLAVEKR
jgi:hypothetical protein